MLRLRMHSARMNHRRRSWRCLHLTYRRSAAAFLVSLLLLSLTLRPSPFSLFTIDVYDLLLSYFSGFYLFAFSFSLFPRIPLLPRPRLFFSPINTPHGPHLLCRLLFSSSSPFPAHTSIMCHLFLSSSQHIFKIVVPFTQLT